MTIDTPKKKIPLNRTTHSVRAAQAVLQYGVGAMIDFPDQTLMCAAPEYWADKVIEIHDERLEKALKVDYFGMPGGKDEIQFRDGISYVRFPEWYFCPKCRKFQSLKKWYKEYKDKATKKEIERDPYMVKKIKCKPCKQDLVVARIITVCEDGHINDFPWEEWVHRRNVLGSREICANPTLTFKTGSSASDGLEGLKITCENCKANTTLKDAFDPRIFERIDSKNNTSVFNCKGNHPWKHKKEKCKKYPKALQRGASSVYFPVTVSSLVIPPYSEKLNTMIENSKAFKDCQTTLSNVPQEIKEIVIQSQLSTWAHNIALEIGVSDNQIIPILERKWCSEEDEIDTLSVKYKAEEYEALNGTVSLKESEAGDFIREEMDIKDYKIPGVKQISLIHKIREVRALVGFSRIQPVGNINYKDSRFVNVKEKETKWYPGYEVRGEGIFIEFCQDTIDEWLKNSPEIENRAIELNRNYRETIYGQLSQRDISPKFLLLHTLAHLLIKQLSFECGYSIASLRERIYCSEEEGKEMAGIFIYTASGDSEGTLGGLVRQGRSDVFGHIFKKAVESALFCSNDPVCILSHGQGRDSLNLASCHSCSLIPETSCEEFNVFLDRGMIVGTFENNELGFFNEWISKNR